MLKSNKNRRVLLIFIIVLVQLFMLFGWGTQKAGFHEDESFCFYNTNRTAGLFYPDREWVDTQELKNEFMVLPGQGHRYDMVRLFQSWDEHPPLFYDLLHMACSFTPGVFSKWQGLVVNMAGFVLIQIMIALSARELVHNEKYSLFPAAAVFLYGLCPMAVSSVMFIRMYNWLTVFVMASVFLHIRLMRRIREEGLMSPRAVVKILIGMTAATALGFLTQYFYILYLFFAGLTMLLFLLRERKGREFINFGIAYCAAQGIGLLLTLIYYPYSVKHLLGGETSQTVIGDFFDIGNVFGRIKCFFDLLNRYAFENLLLILFAVLAAGAVSVHLRAKKRGETRSRMGAAGYQALAAAGFFFLISQTGLILSEKSARYVMPVTPMIYLLILYGFYRIFRSYHPADQILSLKTRRIMTLLIAAAAVIQIGWMMAGNVLFLYREDVPKLAFAKEHADDPVIIAYRPETSYNIWFLTDEVFSYDAVYYMNGADPSQVADDRICSADELVVYLADSDGAEDTLKMLCDTISGEATPMFREDMWTSYLIKK